MPPLVLSSAQRKRLRGLAHDLDPTVMIGKQGLTDAVLGEIDQALALRELIKARFVVAREEKKELAAEIESRLGCACAGLVGHIAILYRPHAEEEKRQIDLG
ncbi:MAG: YhbY family RNA-binding protein [Holophagales bacterium]|jgi:RNA-binding protein|nr:MAG: YhbY family RNA-binding protein [Holophagales bacterium]